MIGRTKYGKKKICLLERWGYVVRLGGKETYNPYSEWILI
jgi:hypothetical protein